MNNHRRPLFAGVAKVDITPKDLDGLANIWKRPFEGVHDRLFLRALVVDNGINTAAIVAADVVEFGDTCPVRERVASETGIPAEHVILAASHSHNAPRVGSITAGAVAQAGGQGTEAYSEMVYDRIVEVVRQAKAALQPARVGVGTGTADVNTNRDEFTPQGWRIGVNPQGPSDKTVWVVKFETPSGDPIAILMNYAVHPVVLGGENRLITGDLAGAVETFVEQHYQDRVVALWTIGPACDQNPKGIGAEPRPAPRNAEGYLLMDALGRIVGQEVVRVAEDIQRMSAEARIEAEARVVSVPAKIPDSGRGFRHDDMKVESVESLQIHLGLLLINHIAITAVSGEVVTNIYWRLRRESPFTNTLMVTMANDRIGNIVDDAAYDTPTFEVTSTPIQRGYAEAAIVNGLVEMMSQY